jgi:hypothetical protein
VSWTPSPQRLDVGERQPEPADVELDVQRQAPAGEREPVPAQPVGVAGVVPHLALEQRVGQRCQPDAVPGWPLPIFCTASAARTRTVSTETESTSVQPAG